MTYVLSCSIVLLLKLMKNYGYDKCMEILDTVTVDEIDILWQLRHMPRFSKKIIVNFIKENYEYYKAYTFKTTDIIKK